MMLDKESFETFKKMSHDIQEVFNRHDFPTDSQLEIGDIVSEMTMIFYHCGVLNGLKMAKQVLQEELQDNDFENHSPNFVI